MFLLNYAAIHGRTEFIMKFRRIVSIALLLCMCFSLVACKSGAGEAKKVVEDFMTALTTYDLDAMAKCVEDIPDNTGSIYKHDIFTEDYYKDLYAAANEKLTYSIVSASSKEVKLKVTMPDVYGLYQEKFMSVLSQAISDDKMQEYVLDEKNDPQLLVIALMITDIESNGIDTVEEEITLSVGKINGEYRILTDDNLKLLMTSKLSLSQQESETETTEENTEA